MSDARPIIPDERRKSPKAYELARELGMSPRALITVARTLGIPLQNRLTRIAPAVVKRLAAHCAAKATDKGSENDTKPQSSQDST